MNRAAKPHSWRRKFSVAFAGLAYAWRTQSSVRVHCICGVFVFGLGALTGISRIEWAILLLAIGLVIGLELLNTAVEAVVDLASPEQADLARIAKDVAAAAVLVSAITALCVGGCVLVPYWWTGLGR